MLIGKCWWHRRGRDGPTPSAVRTARHTGTCWLSGTHWCPVTATSQSTSCGPRLSSCVETWLELTLLGPHDHRGARWETRTCLKYRTALPFPVKVWVHCSCHNFLGHNFTIYLEFILDLKIQDFSWEKKMFLTTPSCSFFFFFTFPILEPGIWVKFYNAASSFYTKYNLKYYMLAEMESLS